MVAILKTYACLLLMVETPAEENSEALAPVTRYKCAIGQLLALWVDETIDNINRG